MLCSSGPTEMDSTIGLNVATDAFSDLHHPHHHHHHHAHHHHHSKLVNNTLPDATGSLFGNKNKFLQLARRLRHTLNHSQLSSSTSLQSKHSKQSSVASSPTTISNTITPLITTNTGAISSSSPRRSTNTSQEFPPAVASLAVAAIAAVASPASSIHSAASVVDQVRRRCCSSDGCSSDLNRFGQEKRNVGAALRQFCGLRLPGGKSNGSSNSSSRASSISSNYSNSSSCCGNFSSSSGFSSSPSSNAASDLSLLQTLALCSLELSAPASEVLLHNRRPSAFQHQPQHRSPATHEAESSSRVPFASFGNLDDSTYEQQMDVSFAPTLEPRFANHLNHHPQQNHHVIHPLSPHSTSIAPTPPTPPTSPCYQPPTNQPAEFIQLSGHRDGFQRRADGRVWKRLSEQPSHELRAYEKINQEPCLQPHVAAFYGQRQDSNGEWFVELGDLLSEFRHPAWLMDIKMGTRTFLEKEVLNAEARSDLYDKMEKTLRTGGERVSKQQLLTDQEREQRALTKLRYMTLREQLSSSSTLGFRVEAYKCNGNAISNDLQYVRQPDQIQNIMSEFLPVPHQLRHQLVQMLRQLRQDLLSSDFFDQHEMIGSSLLIVHDTQRVGVWMIDFAKTIPLPADVHIDHRSKWAPGKDGQGGNHEDGYLMGLDNLIDTLEAL